MINCKCECLYSKHGECTKNDISISVAGCMSKRDTESNTYAKVLNHYGYVKQTQKILEEMNELADAIMGHGNILEELADVMNVLEQLKIMTGTENTGLFEVMTNKMKRTLERIEKE